MTRRISDLEDIELEVMERLEAATAEQDQKASELAELEASMRALIASRDAQLAELDAERAEHQRSRDAAGADATEIPADLLALYDRIRERAGGIGASGAQGAPVWRLPAGGHLECRSTPTPLPPLTRCCAARECERVLVRTSSVLP